MKGFNFSVGNHTKQAHDYAADLIDEAYKRKTTASERIDKANAICEAHYDQVGQYPASDVLSRLAWYILYDEMTDRSTDKVTNTEYPIFNEHQTKVRERRERALADVYTGKNDETIGRRRDEDGEKRRVYDYMTPERDDYMVPSAYLDLYNALDKAGLTDRQRQAIELVYFEGLTQKDAGAEMSVSQPMVVKYIDVSLAKIKEFYRKGYKIGV